MRSFALAFVLCASAAWPCAPAPAEFEREFTRASKDEQVAILEKAMAQGQFDRVVLLAPRFQDDTGAFMPTRLVRELEAQALLKQGDFAHAVKLFDQLLERIPDSVLEMKRAEARVRWAELTGTTDEESVRTLRRLARAGKLDLDARLALARDAVRASRKEEATKLCDEALQLAPKHPEAVQVCAGALPAMPKPVARSRPCG